MEQQQQQQQPQQQHIRIDANRRPGAPARHTAASKRGREVKTTKRHPPYLRRQESADALGRGHSTRRERREDVAELQTAVDGIQRQVNQVSRGIQELRELVALHREIGSSPTPSPAPSATTTDATSNSATTSADSPDSNCISPPAALMELSEDQENFDCLLNEPAPHANTPNPVGCSAPHSTFSSS